MSKHILTVDHCSKTFTAKGSEPLPTLQDICFGIQEGELLAIIGPSGCGKTSLFDCIAGVTLPDVGSITFKELSLIGNPGIAGLMQQQDTLLPWRTVLENVRLPLDIAGINKDEGNDQACSLIQACGLYQFQSYYPHQLSGGMAQRVALARVYASNNPLLLLDEPFGKLDAITKKELYHWFVEFWENHKKTMIFVTHDIDEALLLADRILILSPRPATVIDLVPVPFPRPRQTDLELSPAFLEYKRGIVAKLRQSL